MRPIKFRVWDKDLGIMFNNVSTLHQEAGIYMQYTGLTDKNGREIYEGDVVPFSGDDKELIQKMTVEWTEAEFVLLIDTKDWAYRLTGTPSSCLEVIGSVYENPELLEETK